MRCSKSTTTSITWFLGVVVSTSTFLLLTSTPQFTRAFVPPLTSTATSATTSTPPPAVVDVDVDVVVSSSKRHYQHLLRRFASQLHASTNDNDNDSTDNGKDKDKAKDQSSVPSSDLGIDDLTTAADNALKEAEAALTVNTNTNTNTNINTASTSELNNDMEMEMAREKSQAAQTEAKRIIQQRERESSKYSTDAVIAGLGGSLFGIISGSVLDLFLKANNLDVDIDLIIPPTLLALTVGAAGLNLGKKDDSTGVLVRNVLASPIKGLSASITTSISNKLDATVKDIQSTPEKIQSAIELKVQQTTDDIKQIPDQIRGNIESTVEKTVDDIRQIPTKAKDAASEAIEKAKGDITDATIKTVEEIKATPGKVVQETREAVVKTKEDVEEKVESVVTGAVQDMRRSVDEVASLPSKTMDQVCI